MSRTVTCQPNVSKRWAMAPPMLPMPMMPTAAISFGLVVSP